MTIDYIIYKQNIFTAILFVKNYLWMAQHVVLKTFIMNFYFIFGAVNILSLYCNWFAEFIR